MKTRTLVSILILVLAVMIIAGSCATENNALLSKTEKKSFVTGYFIPEIIEKSDTKIVLDEGLISYYHLKSNAVEVLHSVRFINEIVIVDIWLKNVGENPYTVRPSNFFITDSESLLFPELSPEEAANYIFGFYIPRSFVPHPYLQEAPSYIVTSTVGGYRIYSTPDVYTRLANDMIYIINKSEERKISEFISSIERIKQEMEINKIKQSNIPPNTIKYFQIFYKLMSNKYPLVFYYEEQNKSFQTKFFRPERMAFITKTDFTAYTPKTDLNVRDIIINSLVDLNQFEIVSYTYGSREYKAYKKLDSIENSKNITELSGYIDAQYLFSLELSRSEGFTELTLNIINLNDRKIIYKDVAKTQSRRTTKVVLNLYNKIYNNLKDAILRNYANFHE